MWGAIISAAVGAYTSGKQAQASAEAAQADKRYSRGQGNLYWTQAQQQLERDRYLQDVQLRQNQLNTRLSLEQRDFLRSRMEREDEMLHRERGQQRDRRDFIDKSAASERMWQIQQMLRNQNLSKSERSVARKELQRLQGQYGLERQEDIDELKDYQRTLKSERLQDTQQFTKAQRIKDAERQSDLSLRNQLMQKSSRYADEMEETRKTLGPVTQALSYSPEAIDKIAAGRRAQTDKSIERAVTGMSSGMEADVMRKGMFAPSARPGSMAEDTMARIINNAASMYEQQYNQSYDWARNFMTGQQGASEQAQAAEIARQNALLGRTATTYGSPLEPYLQAAQQTNVGTGLYDRQIATAANRGQRLSATGWAPSLSSVPSAVDNASAFRVGQGYGPQSTLGSAVSWRDPGSGAYDTTRLSAPGVTSLLSGAQGLWGGGMSFNNDRSARMDEYANAAGQGLGTAIDQGFKKWGTWANQRTGPAGSYGYANTGFWGGLGRIFGG